MNNMKYALILCLSLVSVVSCSRKSDPETRSSQPSGMTEETADLGEAPNFEKEALNGEVVRLSDYKGKVVLLNFWATWCAPCRREIPALIELQNKWGDKGLVIMGVALDEEGFEVVRPYADDIGINYPVVMDDYSYGNKLGGVYMVPTTYIIDREGKIVARKIGEITVDAIEPRIAAFLDG